MVAPASAQVTFVAAPTVTVGSNPYSVAVGDFNGDSEADLAVANFNSNNAPSQVAFVVTDRAGNQGSCT